MKFNGNLKKLKSRLNSTIDYFLSFSDQEIWLNKWLGKTISFNHTGLIHCIQCTRKIHKSFQQGFCFPCLNRLKECNICIIYPERCQVEKGNCPIDDWAHAHCHQSHIIYLAVSSGLKVGITRETQVPTRWIDQGAVRAIPIFCAANRYQAGRIEVALKLFVADRTDWRRMLRNETDEIDLLAARDQLLRKSSSSLSSIVSQFQSKDICKMKTDIVTQLNYPVLEYPSKIKTLLFEKTASISGRLLGIKGQYLILDNGVINIRKYGGYHVECIVG